MTREFDFKTHFIRVYSTPNGYYWQAFKRDSLGWLMFDTDGYTTELTLEKLAKIA